MESWKLKLYHRMPAFMRTLVASGQGFLLRTWRYGPETDALAADYSAHEHWSPSQWKAWQQEALAFILHRAATQVPFYRDQWNQRRLQGDRSSWEHLENWPVLSKESVREAPLRFVAEDCDVRRMYHEHTSGTTGKSLDLWWSRATVQRWYALFEARCRLWHGVSRHDRWAILGGQLVTRVQQRQPPFWVWNAGLNQLYMSSYHLAPDLVSSYLDALKQYGIRYLVGYTSSLYMLAVHALRLKRDDLHMQVALTNAEPVHEYQKEVITRAFSCAVRETYGMAELVAAASECPQGRMHMWPEAGIVEVMENGVILPDHMDGNLVCTGLFNMDMPLIRYEVGDRGSLAGQDTCSCGRTLPLLGRVEGRADDILYTADARQIGRLDPVFKSHLPVIEAQIIQESLEEVRIRFVPAPEYRPEDGLSMIERLQARIGNVNVTLEPVAQLPREPNGKFRAVISRIKPEEAAALVSRQ